MARVLYVTSPHMQGSDVLSVQAKLSALGFSPGPLDGAYGPTTAAAVKALQTARGLNADGIVGPMTWAALSTSTGRAPTSRPSLIGQKALAEAKKHIGIKENPPESNRTPFGEWYGWNGVAWCNIFVSYCFKVGAGYTICDGFRGDGINPGKGCSYVPTTSAWLRATGMWVGRTEPQTGDIAIFNWNGGLPDHIGIVDENLGNGQFSTVEGNTAVGNDSNGGQVMARRRYITQVDGFGRVLG